MRSTAPQSAAASGPRQRLPANTRIDHILQAALAEFARHGYANARMDDIAKASHLSKGGLYVHFASKEALLQALLEQMVASSTIMETDWWPKGVQTLEEFIDAYVEYKTSRLDHPSLLPTVRILFTELAHLPANVRAWQVQSLQAYQHKQRRILQRAIQEGLLSADFDTDHYTFLLMPFFYTLVDLLVREAPPCAQELQAIRQQHKTALLRLLRP